MLDVIVLGVRLAVCVCGGGRRDGTRGLFFSFTASESSA